MVDAPPGDAWRLDVRFGDADFVAAGGYARLVFSRPANGLKAHAGIGGGRIDPACNLRIAAAFGQPARSPRTGLMNE